MEPLADPLPPCFSVLVESRAFFSAAGKLVLNSSLNPS